MNKCIKTKPVVEFFALLLLLWSIIVNATAQACIPDSIIFTSQAQVDAFSSDYPGCSEILGKVIIEDDFFGGQMNNLNGLIQVKSIGGDLQIKGSKYLNNLFGLDSLKFIGGDLVVNSYALHNLTGLDNLQRIIGSLNVSYNFGSFTNPGGFTAIQGLNNLNSIGGNLIIESNPFLSNINGLNNLSYIGGGLSIGYNPHLASFNGFASLDSIFDKVDIWENSSLSTLVGLNELKFIKSDININSDSSLTNLQGLNALSAIGGNLTIGGNIVMTDFAGLDSLKTIGGNLQVQSNPLIVQMIGLNNLKNIGETLFIYENENLINLTGLNSLEKVDGGMQIENNSKFINFTGIDRLFSLAGGLGIQNNQSLVNFSGLDSLIYVGGALYIKNNISLNSLLGLHSLKSMGSGFIKIIGNPKIESLSGLDSIDYTTINGLEIQNCENLNFCSVKSICDYLNNIGGLISNNSQGCNSSQEVIDVCISSADAFSTTSHTYTLSPNPSSTDLVITINTFTPKGTSIELYDLTGNLVQQKTLDESSVGNITCRLDMSSIPNGMYYVILKTKQFKVAQKVIVQK